MAKLDVAEVLTVHGLGAEGDGLAKDSAGNKWIVRGGLPGDRARPTTSRKKGDFLIAEAIELVKASPDRQAPHCPVARCGGCVLREYAPGAALEHKRNIVVSLLARAGIGAEVVAPPRSNAVLAARHRVRLHAHGANVGFYEHGSHRTVAIEGCAVLLPDLYQGLLPVASALRKSAKLFGEVEAVASAGRLALEMVASDKTTEAELWQLAHGFIKGGLASGIIAKRGKAERRYGEPWVSIAHPDGGEIYLEPGAFSQANLGMNEVLVACVAAAVPDGAKVLELHAGAGNLSFGYAAKAARVVATEWDERAVMCLRRNLEARPQLTHMRVEAGKDSEALAAHLSDATVLVIDPPRTGAKEVASALGADPGVLERVVYVSCDPASLARDASALAPYFECKTVTPVEMFPGTPHIEAVAVFDRRDRA